MGRDSARHKRHCAFVDVRLRKDARDALHELLPHLPLPRPRPHAPPAFHRLRKRERRNRDGREQLPERTFGTGSWHNNIRAGEGRRQAAVRKSGVK